MLTILLVIAVLMLLGVLPAWPHSRSWGYAPSGGLGAGRAGPAGPAALRSSIGPPWAAASVMTEAAKGDRP